MYNDDDAESNMALNMDQRRDDQQVGFSLSGDQVSAGRFIGAASKLIDLLKELETSVLGNGELDWHIADLHLGSANLAVRPYLQEPAERAETHVIIDAALKGLAVVEAAASRPPHFTDQALRHAKSLVGAAQGGAKSLTIFGEANGFHHRVVVTNRLALHVDKLIGPATGAIGSLEGTIEALTIHDSVAFSIYESITGRRVVCKCDRGTLDLAIKHLGNRVSVSGEVNYSAKGDPTSIRVHAVRALGTQPLPQVKDIRGLFSDHKIDVKEWARFVRED